MTRQVYELNLDGLVGPTHHYAGLSVGNLASIRHAHCVANPKAAAMQGIAKMRVLYQMGIPQALTPPQQRPNLSLLSQLGFSGPAKLQLEKALRTDKRLLSACYSASSMWAANAATVSPSSDTQDNKVHFTPANLINNLHRQQEAEFTSKILKLIFANPKYFKHHSPLPGTVTLADEGAANHSRICQNHQSTGIHLFVYGKKSLSDSSTLLYPNKYPARQTIEASQAVARRHLLDANRTIFCQQNPDVIDHGVFHNDVISVANENFFLLHESAFVDQNQLITQLKNYNDFHLQILEVKNSQVSVQEAVQSYLFNSQIVSLPSPNGLGSQMVMIAPSECQSNHTIRAYLEDLACDQNNPISKIEYIDIKQSMKNGGGPACLRLRIVLTQEELAAMHQKVLVNDELLNKLEKWVQKHYRDQLYVDELADPALIEESFSALDELTTLLNIGSIYPFQYE